MQASPPKQQIRMNMNRQTNAKQLKARIQLKRNKQTAWECRKQLCYKTEKVNVWSQIYRVIYQKTVLYWLYCTQWWWSYLVSRTWYAIQFHNIIVVPTIEYRRSKIKVLHTTQDIKVSIKSNLYENIPAPLLHTLAEAIDSAASCLFSAQTGFIT